MLDANRGLQFERPHDGITPRTVTVYGHRSDIARHVAISLTFGRSFLDPKFNQMESHLFRHGAVPVRRCAGQFGRSV